MGRLKGATPLDDYSGLLMSAAVSRDELNALEFANINKAIQKYLLKKPSKSLAPFIYEWFLRVHREMFDEVWAWAGQIRKTNKSIGIDKLGIREALKNVEKDIAHWEKSQLGSEEIAVRIRHRLVWVHPFENGNGRWARLLVNIYLKREGLSLIVWPEENLIAKTDIRERYLRALREADRHNFKPLIALHKELS